MQDRTVKCKIDLAAQVIEIEAHEEIFASIAQQAQDMVCALGQNQSAASKATGDVKNRSAGLGSDAATASHETASGRKRSARSSGGSAGRPGRIGSFEPVDFRLSEDHERQLLAFYSEKQPNEQSHKVAVAMCGGERVLDRQSFSYNEIYTLLRLSGEKSLPKALDVVMQRLIKENWATRTEDGFALKFMARDFVDQSMPHAT